VVAEALQRAEGFGQQKTLIDQRIKHIQKLMG
jgi:hypothetical protein